MWKTAGLVLFVVFAMFNRLIYTAGLPCSMLVPSSMRNMTAIIRGVLDELLSPHLLGIWTAHHLYRSQAIVLFTCI